MDIKRLARIEDSAQDRSKAFLKFKKLNSKEYKELVDGFSMDDDPINFIENGKVQSYEGVYKTSKTKVGDYTVYLSIQTTSYIDKDTKEVVVDVDDLSGAVRDEDHNNVGGRDLFFSVLDNIEDDLKEDLEAKLKARLMKDKKYSKFLKKGVKDSEDIYLELDEDLDSFDELVNNLEKSFSQIRPRLFGDRIVIPSAAFINKVVKTAENLGCEIASFKDYIIISEPKEISDSTQVEFVDRLKSMIGTSEKEEVEGIFNDVNLFVEATYTPRYDNYSLWLIEATKNGETKSYEFIIENEEDLDKALRKIEFDFSD